MRLVVACSEAAGPRATCPAASKYGRALELKESPSERLNFWNSRVPFRKPNSDFTPRGMTVRTWILAPRSHYHESRLPDLSTDINRLLI